MNLISTEERKCIRCNSNKLVTDTDSAEVFCAKCGYVIPEKLQRMDQEGRAFTRDEFYQKMRTGTPTSIAIHDMGLATVINTSNRDAADRPLKVNMRYVMQRLRTQDHRSKFNTHNDINQNRAFNLLEFLKEKLNLPGHISERAAYIYRKTLGKKISRGRSIRGIITACVYAACRETDIDRSIHDFEKASNVNRREISRDYRLLLKELNLNISVLSPIKCISRIANNLELNERTRRYAIKLLKTAEQSGIVAGKDPRGMAACALYIACLKYGECHTQRNIASVANVTEVTVRNRYRDFSKHCLN